MPVPDHRCAVSGMTRMVERRYFFPGTCVNGEVPTDTAGFGFSALGLRISLLLRA